LEEGSGGLSNLHHLPFISPKLEDVFIFFQNQTCNSYRFLSDLMDVFSMAGVHQQAEQPNYLAEGQTLL